MPICVCCVGRMSELYKSAAEEYEKRLTRYTKLQICQIEDAPESDPKAMEKEGRALLRHVKPGDHVIALCVDARQWQSERFAARLGQLRESGARVVFLIGGSLGLSDEALARADERMSLSDMTFPHQLARVMLLEQIYRAHKILAGERYHK